MSVRPGESIALHVSTNPALPFAIDVHRRTTSRAPNVRLRLGPLPGRVQPDPPIGSFRLGEFEWEP